MAEYRPSLAVLAGSGRSPGAISAITPYRAPPPVPSAPAGARRLRGVRGLPGGVRGLPPTHYHQRVPRVSTLPQRGV